jgi:hypothetical protein
MKATLIKKAEGWYNLYQDKIGIGSTYPELQGYKLSKQNCDEIFGVTDVEKLADERFLGSDDITIYNLRFGFKEGFNKAMELNKDKQFTLEDMKKAISFGQGMDLWKEEEQIDKFIQSLQQPTEIEVEVEMEDVIQLKTRSRYITNMGKPKLDAEGCIILKKAR